MHRGRCHHTWQSHAVPSQHQRSSGSCCIPDPAGVSQAPGGSQALRVSALGWHCQGCRASARQIPLSSWAPRGGSSCSAAISQRGFTVLASPRGVLLCWHCPAWLRSAVSHRPAPASHLSLPPKGTLLAHSRRDLKGHTKYPSPLFSPLHWGFCMDLTTWKQPHASAQPALLGRQSIRDVHKSSEPGCSKPAVTTHSEGTTCSCPWEVAFLFYGGRGTCQSSRNGILPFQFSSCMPQLYSMTLGEGHFVQNLKFSGPGHQGNASNHRSWQHSLSLWALPCAHGGTCMALCRVWGWGLLGRAATTESSSILAWSLLASPLGTG